ncbi:MAG: choice-of-anchor D domain-containing protein [Acidobacteria bacterium]|nr:choice-of-anchor D domain-containing protein [Acidobacteriota bacterium]
MRIIALFFGFLSIGHAGRYLVELKAPSPAESVIASRARNPREAALRMRTGVRAALERSRAAIGLREAEIVYRMDFLINGFAVDISEEPTRELAAKPEVRAVHDLNAPMRYILDEAIGLLKVREAMALVSPEKSGGAGVKIGIIDSSLDIVHPAFQDPELPMPEGFPKGDLTKTSNKIISYKTYGEISAGAGLNVRQHGTFVAAAAAGALHESPLGPISGIAPKAWIAFCDVGDPETLRILKVFEDAAADGIDVLNFSVAFLHFPRPSGQRFFEVVAERAMQLGTAIVWGAANQGPERTTISASSVSEANLVVGGARNTRYIGGTLKLADGASFPIVPYEGITLPAEPITARLRQVRDLEAVTGACNPLPENSLSGQIALVDHIYPCRLAQRTANLVKAGAKAIIAYRTGVPFTSSPGPASEDIPAAAMGFDDVLALLQTVSAGAEVTLTIAREKLPADPALAYNVTSAGPTHDFKIRPDLVGVAQHVYAPLPDNSWGVRDGTSIATPMVAGGLAVLKAARPQLTPPQLYSLVTNTATPMNLPVMVTGAGRMNLEAAMKATLTALPRSLSFGAGAANVDQTRELTITNLGDSVEVVELTAQAAEGQSIPAISPPSINVPAGQSAKVTVRFQASNLRPNEYQGFVRAVGQASGTELRIAYWYAVPSGVPAAIKVLGPTEFNVGSTYRHFDQMPQIRILDTSGLPMTNITPRVSVLSGGATLNFLDAWSENPGVFYPRLRFGPNVGNVVLRVQAGAITKDHILSVGGSAYPHIEFSINGLDFGGVLTGSSRDLDFTLNNTGGAALIVSNPVFSDPQFRIVSPNFPLTIAPGASARIVIRFTPARAAAVQGASVRFEANEPGFGLFALQLAGTGAPPAGPLTLQVDSGVFSNSFGYGGGGAQQAFFVNRLTPPKYPAVLQSVQIFFSDRPDGLRLNVPITAIARPNPEGGERLQAFSFLQSPGTITRLNAFNSFPFPQNQTLRIESGDFVVGFSTSNPQGIFPAEIDRSNPSQRRSYTSADGQPFTVIDVESNFPGNFLIRAVVTFP